MPKVALGLFHFNVQWLAGDTSSYHRYVNESLEPFLRMIERNPAFRVSLEMAGTGLEFLQDSYPDVLRRVRRLIHEERIELISSTFSPSAWIAYPGTDLRRSIEVNRRTLERLGLPISRIFFAQEAFFGDGIRGLGKYFDWAICKDEYLDYYFDIEFTSPVYKLGDIKVLPASNHILNELSKRLCGPEPSRTGPVLGPSHRRHLKLASQECSQIPYRGATGTAGDLEWAWYHCGDGNHATSMFPPHDWERCFQDPWWTQITEWLLNTYVSDGFELITISDFGSRISTLDAPELPRLIEGNWNCRRSLGVFQWMGKHENPWENDNAVLALVSRTRRRLLALEAWCSSSAVLEDPQVADLFETAWRALLLAESSDPLGWRPHQGEVTFAVGYCDRALRVLAEIEALLEEQRPAPENYGLALPAAKLLNEPPIVLRVLGAEYDAVWAHVQPNLWHVEVWLRFNGDKVRVGFPLSVQAVGYSPSGLEQELVTIPFDQLRPRAVHVPAANGLVQVGEESFVIKDTSTVHLAARIDRDTELVEFVVDGAAPGKETAWRFWLFRGTAAAAVDMANKLNMC